MCSIYIADKAKMMDACTINVLHIDLGTIFGTAVPYIQDCTTISLGFPNIIV